MRGGAEVHKHLSAAGVHTASRSHCCVHKHHTHGCSSEKPTFHMLLVTLEVLMSNTASLDKQDTPRLTCERGKVHTGDSHMAHTC